MSDDFRQQLRENFEQKETGELISIWQTNDRTEWSSLSFEIVEEILRERSVELPAQDEPILVKKKVERTREENDPASLLYPYLNKEHAPVLYSPRNVMRLERWLNGLAVAMAALIILQGSSSVWSVFFIGKVSFLDWLKSWNLAAFLTLGMFLANAAVIFVCLKALAFILKMLMQMEFRSRGIGD